MCVAWCSLENASSSSLCPMSPFGDPSKGEKAEGGIREYKETNKEPKRAKEQEGKGGTNKSDTRQTGGCDWLRDVGAGWVKDTVDPSSTV